MVIHTGYMKLWMLAALLNKDMLRSRRERMTKSRGEPECRQSGDFVVIPGIRHEQRIGSQWTQGMAE